MGLVQKCGGKGTVLPRQRTARVRISLIFMGLLHDRVYGVTRSLIKVQLRSAKSVECSAESRSLSAIPRPPNYGGKEKSAGLRSG